MIRYTVWHAAGKRDGAADFDDLRKANIEYEDQVSLGGVSSVELVDNLDPDHPETIRSYDARTGYDT